MPYANGGLNSRSRSVPEGLAHPPNGDIHWNYNQNRNVAFARPYARQQQQAQHVQVLEQLTTTV